MLSQVGARDVADGCELLWGDCDAWVAEVVAPARFDFTEDNFIYFGVEGDDIDLVFADRDICRNDLIPFIC